MKGYAQHEDEIFTKVAEARSALLGAVKSGDPEQMAAANAQTTSALGRLLAISENYPQLKADQSFIRLQDELTGRRTGSRWRAATTTRRRSSTTR